MKTFKNYLKIIYKNKLSILIYLVIFTALLFVNNGSADKDLSTNYVINVVDYANNKESKDLTNFLEKKYKVSTDVLTKDEAKDLLFGEITDYVLFIEKDNSLSYFSKEDSIKPVAINIAINEYINTNRTLTKFNIENPKESTLEILDNNAEYEILDSSSQSYTEQFYIFLTYVILAVLLSVIFIAHHAFLKDGVQSRVRISRTKLSKFNFSLYISSIAFVALLCGVFSLIEFSLNKTDVKIALMMFLNLILFAIPIVALAYVISSLSSNSKVNGSLSNIISMVLCFISGAFVPQEFLPEYLLKFSSIFPPFWYIKGVVATQGQDYNLLLKVFVIQLVITVVLIIVNSVIAKFKKSEFAYTR